MICTLHITPTPLFLVIYPFPRPRRPPGRPDIPSEYKYQKEISSVHQFTKILILRLVTVTLYSHWSIETTGN